MDFVYDLPHTRNGHDGIWVIVDRLTKSAHFLPIAKGYKLENLARLYVDEIVRLAWYTRVDSFRSGALVSLRKFWVSLQKALGTQSHFSTAFHPQTDGQSERTIPYLGGYVEVLCYAI